jgi:hypothetical protein
VQGARQLTMMANQPPYEHIKLSTLELRAVYEFCTAVQRYQVAHKLTIPVSTLITIVDSIIMEDPALSEEKFHGMNMYEIQKLLQSKVRPKTREAFTHNMEQLVHFGRLPTGFAPNCSTKRLFHEALAAFKTKFLRFYEMQASDNDDNVPETVSKTKGLARVLTDKIPFEYGWNLVNRMPVKCKIYNL